MDELKLLIEMVASLPQMALWVLIGFWVYKVIVIGSIYGVIRFAVVYTYKMYTAGKVENSLHKLDGITMTGSLSNLISALKSVTGVHLYLHEHHIVWLREAIEEKKAKEEAVKREKDASAWRSLTSTKKEQTNG